jgi:dihydrolipoamide dehydrogenase
MVVGEFTQEVDLLIIGAGPGGYTAAFRAAAMGKTVAMVDPHATPGGRCLHEACIPKTMLASPELLPAGGDLEAARARVDEVVGQLAKALATQAATAHVEFMRGTAHCVDDRTIQITNDQTPGRVKFRRAILATGSIPTPAIDIDDDRVITVEQAIGSVPSGSTVAVCGSDGSAVEAATILSRGGCSVTLVHEPPRLLPTVDEALVKVMTRGFRELGVAVTDGSIPDGTQWIVTSTPRRGCTDDLNLAVAGVDTDDAGFVVRDEMTLRCGDSRIFAVGDVAGGVCLASRAMLEGDVAARRICGEDTGLDSSTWATCILGPTPLAYCGLTQQDAIEEQIPHRVLSCQIGQSGIAVAMGRSRGVLRLIVEENSDRVLGVGICGHNAEELITQGLLAVEMGATTYDLASLLPPHPSISELLSIATR